MGSNPLGATKFMKEKFGYSEKELRMIEELSPFWIKLIKEGKADSFMPPDILKMVAMDSFLEKKEGKAVDSLRRCIKAIQRCDPYRMTPEYEALIDLKEETELYPVHGMEQNNKCPLCGEELGGCAAGVYCSSDKCGYIDGYARLTLTEAKKIKHKLGWGSLEERQRDWKRWGLEE